LTPHEGRYQILVVKKGVHTVAIALEAQKDESTESLQPKVMARAKMALARLP
jgi:hypothetical protein